MFQQKKTGSGDDKTKCPKLYKKQFSVNCEIEGLSLLKVFEEMERTDLKETRLDTHFVIQFENFRFIQDY